MIQKLFILPRPIFLLLLLYSTAAASNPHLRWDIHVVSSNSSYQIDSYALPSIQPSSNYKFRVRIVNAQDNSVCSTCAKEFSAIGGNPIIQFNSQQKTIVAASVNNTWRQDIREPVSEWLIPFMTSSSGHLLIDVTTNGFSTPRLINGGLDDGQFDFSVSPFQRMNERGEIQHLLGTKISVANAAFKPNSPNQFKLDFIPEVSTESFAISNRLDSSFVLLSEDDWESFEILKLAFHGVEMNELSDNVCDGTVGLNLHSYIAYQNTTLIHTDAGLFQAKKTKTGGYEYVRVLKECISGVQYTTQADEYAPECLTTFAFGKANKKIWKMIAESGIFQELLGVSQTTITQFLNDPAIEIIGGDKSVIACEIDVFLVKTSNGKFSVVTFNYSSRINNRSRVNLKQ
ncbi:hypothetical protein BKA69DRAFT_746416 [Paraphysoderma sedebokerense]|nr:hypothetical protein BKA69DRAFT_746416 [Paraphysoderma sedebokerense]